ncbi:hypothetical protein DFP72DRAFT_902548 [Ephemerocybe angulata]|uniref:Uncharacterized protein n=1 Tax=Ephemerocybe angulata TaxID=980116 RepID=A0A8H6HWX3_9AGAR|nr:hypothetical protein DFP72DRAFT_902548 [Tulosesus angulatus]
MRLRPEHEHRPTVQLSGASTLFVPTKALYSTTTSSLFFLGMIPVSCLLQVTTGWLSEWHACSRRTRSITPPRARTAASWIPSCTILTACVTLVSFVLGAVAVLQVYGERGYISKRSLS